MEKCSVLIDWKNLFAKTSQVTNKFKSSKISTDLKSQAILCTMNRMEEVKLGDLHQQSIQKGADVCTETDQWKRTEQADTKPSEWVPKIWQRCQEHTVEDSFFNELHCMYKHEKLRVKYHVILNKHRNKGKYICHPKVRWEAIQTLNDAQRLYASVSCNT